MQRKVKTVAQHACSLDLKSKLDFHLKGLEFETVIETWKAERRKFWRDIEPIKGVNKNTA